MWRKGCAYVLFFKVTLRIKLIMYYMMKFMCRAVSYYVEGVLLLLPFAKQRVTLKLNCVTNDAVDISVDTLRTVTLRLLKVNR